MRLGRSHTEETATKKGRGYAMDLLEPSAIRAHASAQASIAKVKEPCVTPRSTLMSVVLARTFEHKAQHNDEHNHILGLASSSHIHIHPNRN